MNSILKRLVHCLFLMKVSSIYVGDYNILVMNDIHYNTNWTYNSSGCYLGTCLEYGIYGEDSPWALIEAVVERAAEENQNVDGIVITGDFIMHDFNLSNGLLPEQKWATVK